VKSKSKLITFPLDLFDWIEASAKEKGLNVSAFVRFLLIKAKKEKQKNNADNH
jgi:hypothetical protein